MTHSDNATDSSIVSTAQMTQDNSGNAPTAQPSIPKSLDQLEAKLGHQFKSKSSIERALTHRSLFAKGAESDYERLEFLGDAVLDLAVAHLLLAAHLEAREGELSKMRAALVNTNSLAEIAREIGLGQYIRLSRSEAANGGAERPSILADVVEALIGAVYRDGGFEAALNTTQMLFGSRIAEVSPRDPKTELQERMHALGKAGPEYLLECVEGPEHAPTFVTIVRVNGVEKGRGRGATKKASQQEAAAEALKLLE